MYAFGVIVLVASNSSAVKLKLMPDAVPLIELCPSRDANL